MRAFLLFLGIGCGVLFILVLALAGWLTQRAANGALAEEGGDEVTIEFARYTLKQRRRARSRGALAAESGKGPSFCPYAMEDEPLRQEWLAGHILEKMRRHRAGWKKPAPPVAATARPLPPPTKAFWQRRREA